MLNDVEFMETVIVGVNALIRNNLAPNVKNLNILFTFLLKTHYIRFFRVSKIRDIPVAKHLYFLTLLSEWKFERKSVPPVDRPLIKTKYKHLFVVPQIPGDKNIG